MEIVEFDTGLSEDTRQKKLEMHVKEIISLLDAERKGLVDTPERVAKSLLYLTQGYGKTAKDVVGRGMFEETVNEMVIVGRIEFYSLCEHHLLPFYGKCHVGYLPNEKILGLSKIPRIVDIFARRLQVQERMTNQIAEELMDLLDAKGVGVITEAVHLCMMMRGVEKQNSVTWSSAMRGVFKENSSTRAEFLNLIRPS